MFRLLMYSPRFSVMLEHFSVDEINPISYEFSINMFVELLLIYIDIPTISCVEFFV